ncbi:protein JASON-like [Lycium barbarum]|uniref:protein JASON-like n=1 Tax=Lycium barbarum TaxID=112863 RepID=UPI00293F2060|nr:protein JASON-like [Lycium barbarum]XP_060189613.1 protein JASON-like [Lycium barbarum]
MLWSRLPSEEQGDDTKNILGVFTVLVRAAMGCFFGCFRINDGSIPPKEPLVSRNRSPLSSFFNSEEKGEDDDLHKTKMANQDTGTPMSELVTKELRDQAKFLKACGTLPQTPAEIRKGLAKCKDLSASTGDVEPLRFKSWLSDVAVEKLNLDLLNDHPITPRKSNGLEEQSGSLAHTSSSCMMAGQNGQSLSKNSIHGSGSSNTPTAIEVNANQTHTDTASEVTPTSAPSAQYMNKVVRFDCESDQSAVSSKSTSSALDSENSKHVGFSGNSYASKNSPYPTPLKLSDEMQTPGTVFPTYLDNIANGKTARIRSQYVYPVLNPVVRASQLKELSDEDSYSIEDSSSRLRSSNMTESGERLNEATFSSELGSEASADKDSKAEASLSSWLKPSSLNQHEGKQHASFVYCDNVHYGRTPGDRPILGLVAAHWKDDEDSRISPKWWDGNGIPNSTNKYKEDQKVSWHATPFEERLEKALSQETSIPQRKQLSGTRPFAFNDMEESDTALSQVH